MVQAAAISELEIARPSPPPTLHLSRAMQKPNSADIRTDRSEARPTPATSPLSKKRPFKDVGNSARLPIPSSFVDDVLFRLNQEDSDDDDVGKDSPRKKPAFNKESLRQKLQQCKTELQSSRAKEPTDRKANDHPNETPYATLVVGNVTKIQRKQRVSRLKGDEPKDKGTSTTEKETDANCDDPPNENIESDRLEETITPASDAKPITPVNRDEISNNMGSNGVCINQGVDMNFEDIPGEITKHHDSKKSTTAKVVRKSKRAARWKSVDQGAEQKECLHDDLAEVHSRDHPHYDSKLTVNPMDEVTKYVLPTEQVALSIRGDPVGNLETNGDLVNRDVAANFEDHPDETVKGKGVTKALRKTKRTTRLKMDHESDNEECANVGRDLNLRYRALNTVKSNQLEEAIKDARKPRRAAGWKSDEPVDRSDICAWKLDLSQSDSAIEKALIQRLRKLEAITDQYDEQTDVVRRKLKKHRRSMWLKRQQSGLDLRSSIPPVDPMKGKPTLGRFLPDVQEFVQLDDALWSGNGRSRPSNSEIQRIQGNLFGQRKVATTASQPTLTQMIRGTKDPLEDHDISMKQSDVPYAIEEINVADLTVDESGCSDESLPDVSSNAMALDDNDEMKITEMYSTRPCVKVQSPPPKVHRLELCNSPIVFEDFNSGHIQSNQYVSSSSCIWDAFRYGMYDSSWDQWLMDTASRENHAAVNDLLQLLNQSLSSPSGRLSVKSSDGMLSPSCLSTRAQTLASTVVENVNSNEVLCPIIDHLNPDWKENVCFALVQKDEGDVMDALNNVRNTQQALKCLKNEILSNLERHEMLLSVYEDALQISLSRFGASYNPPIPRASLLSPTANASPSKPLAEGTSRCGGFQRDALVGGYPITSQASRGSSPVRSTCSS
jgi:hypothetical protein